MAIHIEVDQAKITDLGLQVEIKTTNDSNPGVELRYGKAYDTSLTAAQIKSEIGDDCTLMWQAYNIAPWSV